LAAAEAPVGRSNGTMYLGARSSLNVDLGCLLSAAKIIEADRNTTKRIAVKSTTESLLRIARPPVVLKVLLRLKKYLADT